MSDKRDIYSGRDPREIPAYTISDASHNLKIPLPTLRSWIRGRTLKSGQDFKPLIVLPDRKIPMLSFMNLVEAYVLDSIRHKHKVTMKKVRKAFDYLNKRHPSKYPLAEIWFQTDGIDLFIEKFGDLINVSRYGQVEMKEIIETYLKRIDLDSEGLAYRFYPFITKRHQEDASKLIVINPRISFGKPVLAGTGIPTAVILDRFLGGDKIAEIAEDYGRPPHEIEEAIRFENNKKAAA